MYAIRVQAAQHVFHAIEDAVVAPACFVHVLQVKLHGALDQRRVVIQRWRETGPQWRADPATQMRLVRNLPAKGRQRGPHAGEDAGGGIDQGSVKIEEPVIEAPVTHAPRPASAATAGSTLPSQNSRNAPPPVEI